MGDDDEWYRFFIGEGYGKKTKAGVYVNEEVALTFSACWCATRVIAETIAMLPLLEYEKQSGDAREFATDHYLYPLLKDAPNPEMGSMAWREGRLHHQVNWGNAFSEIEWDSARPERRTRIVAFWPIHPSRVRPVCESSSPEEYRQGYRYVVGNDDGTSVLMRADEVLHIPGPLSDDGIWGKGVVQYARESIGAALGAEQHAANTFGDGNMPGAVLKLPGMKDPGVRKQFRAEWKEVHSGPTGDKLAIIPPEGDFLPITQFSNEDAQWLASRQHSVEEICRWYRVYPHMIMHLLRSTFSNIEHQGIEAVTYSFLPWIRRWEEQINLKCLLPHERGRYYVEHQVAGLLRGDIKSRYEAYMTALQNGIMSINEVRRLENLNPVKGGDQHFIQLNMTTIDRVGEAQDAKQQAATDQKPPKDDSEMLVAMDRLTARFVQATENQAKAMADAVQAIPAANVVVQPSTTAVQVAAPNVHFMATVDVPPTVVNVPAANISVAPAAVSVIAPVDVQVPAPIVNIATPTQEQPAATQQQPNVPQEAMWAVLEDAIRRMLVKESNAAKRKATSPDFEAWLEGFHKEQHATFSDMLRPSATLLQAAGRAVSAGKMVDHVLEKLRSGLCAGYGGCSRAKFTEMLESLPDRSGQWAKEILEVVAAEEK